MYINKISYKNHFINFFNKKRYKIILLVFYDFISFYNKHTKILFYLEPNLLILLFLI